MNLVSCRSKNSVLAEIQGSIQRSVSRHETPHIGFDFTAWDLFDFQKINPEDRWKTLLAGCSETGRGSSYREQVLRSLRETSEPEKAFRRLDLAIVSVGELGEILGLKPGWPFIDRNSTKDRDVNSFPMTLSIEELVCAHDLIVITRGHDCKIEDVNWIRGPIHENSPASIVRLHKNPTIVYPGITCDWTEPKDYKVEQARIDILDSETDLKGSVLFFCPHPDDASISAGGTLGSWSGKVKPIVVAMTSGHRAEQESVSRENRQTCRMQELQRECEDLSVDLLCPELDFYDGNQFFSSGDVLKLIDLLQKNRPQICMIPNLDDRHPTHRSCSYMVREAIRSAFKTRMLRTLEVWEYEGPWFLHSPENMNLVVALSEEAMERKLKAIRRHQSQIRRTAYDQGAVGLSRYRAVTLPELCLTGFGSHRAVGEYVEVFQKSIWST